MNKQQCKEQRISDLRTLDSYGLKRVHELLFDFRFNQEWELIQLDQQHHHRYEKKNNIVFHTSISLIF